MLHTNLLILTILSMTLVNCFEWKYHNNEALEQYLKNFDKNKTSPIKTRLYSIGKSVKKNELWVLEMTAAEDGKIGIPNIKLIGTIHGNEPVGREILLLYMEFLRDNYATDPLIGWLLNNTRIHFLPNLNPDGFAIASENMCAGDHGRTNGLRGKDLNRNFPDHYHTNKIPEDPEARAVKKWLSEVPFILSAGLHGGAIVANYPFDTVKERTSASTHPPSQTPDDDVFVHLATAYAKHHSTMHKGIRCDPNDPVFKGGITNGAAWYVVTGGMQDYNYVHHGCMEITLEISCCKYPKATELPGLWDENRKALLMYSLEALKGVTGQILDGDTLKPVARAKLKISGRNMTFSSAKTGEFWRLLLPGNYQLEISAEGYYDHVVPFVVENYEESVKPELTFLNISLVNLTVTTTTTQTKTKMTESTSDSASTTKLYSNKEVGPINMALNSDGPNLAVRQDIPSEVKNNDHIPNLTVRLNIPNELENERNSSVQNVLLPLVLLIFLQSCFLLL